MEKFQTKHVNYLFIIQSPMRNSDFILLINKFRRTRVLSFEGLVF
jgi:hypothetical protein